MGSCTIHDLIFQTGTLAQPLAAELQFRLGFPSTVVPPDEGLLSVVEAGKLGETERLIQGPLRSLRKELPKGKARCSGAFVVSCCTYYRVLTQTVTSDDTNFEPWHEDERPEMGRQGTVVPRQFTPYLRLPVITTAGILPLARGHGAIARTRSHLNLRQLAYVLPNVTARKPSCQLCYHPVPRTLPGARLLAPAVGKAELGKHRPLPLINMAAGGFRLRAVQRGSREKNSILLLAFYPWRAGRKKYSKSNLKGSAAETAGAPPSRAGQPGREGKRWRTWLARRGCVCRIGGDRRRQRNSEGVNCESADGRARARRGRRGRSGAGMEDGVAAPRLGEAAEAAEARVRPEVTLRPFAPFSGAAEADEGGGDWSFIDCEMEEVDMQDLPSATIACHLDPRVFVDGLCRVRAGVWAVGCRADTCCWRTW